MSEKNAERLENMSPIGVDGDGNVLIKGEDWHWLGEQAERAQEFDGYTQKYVTFLKLYWEENERLRKVVQRMEKASEQSK